MNKCSRVDVKIALKLWKVPLITPRILFKMFLKSTRKRSQIDEIASLERFRRQIAPRSAPRALAWESVKIFASLFFKKMSLQGSFLEPLENRKSVKNRICEHRRALWPSKSGVWEWVRKKHQYFIKFLCENRRFLMARNHVWHYTLRLFYTFAILETNWKMNAKIDAQRQLFGAKT